MPGQGNMLIRSTLKCFPLWLSWRGWWSWRWWGWWRWWWWWWLLFLNCFNWIQLLDQVLFSHFCATFIKSGICMIMKNSCGLCAGGRVANMVSVWWSEGVGGGWGGGVGETYIRAGREYTNHQLLMYIFTLFDPVIEKCGFFQRCFWSWSEKKNAPKVEYLLTLLQRLLSGNLHFIFIERTFHCALWKWPATKWLSWICTIQSLLLYCSFQ